MRELVESNITEVLPMIKPFSDQVTNVTMIRYNKNMWVKSWYNRPKVFTKQTTIFFLIQFGIIKRSTPLHDSPFDLRVTFPRSFSANLNFKTRQRQIRSGFLISSRNICCEPKKWTGTVFTSQHRGCCVRITYTTGDIVWQYGKVI
jgi:hypothetical protein